ncbi:MAG: insulinase family protein [Bdellovibrionales bacterium]|nr:insulinase family protein [Bdellovibrionales bacterium]
MEKKTLPFFGNSRASRYRFSNGLRLIVVESRVAPVFSYQTWYDVGSRDEEAGLSGIAHLFEHMMFKETKRLKHGEFDRLMESNGARDLNAFTSTDYTAYVQSLPVEKLDLVAGLESQRMHELRLTKELFDSEREVVHNERKQRTENNPEGQMFEALQALAFVRHPYGRPVIGWEEDLNRMTIDDCRRFYSRYYAPDNAVIVVVGDVKPDKVAATIRKHYGKFSPGELRRTEPAQEPPQHEERVREMKLNLQVEKVYAGYKIPGASHRDQAALSVLGSVMSTGRSSRLYRALVDKGLTMDVSAGPGTAKDESLFYVSFAAQAGKKAQTALSALDAQVALLQHDVVTAEELERAKAKLKTEFFMGLGTNVARANFVGQFEIVLGDFTKALTAIEEINEVSLEEVRNVARRYLPRQNRCVVVGLPAGPGGAA